MIQNIKDIRVGDENENIPCTYLVCNQVNGICFAVCAPIVYNFWVLFVSMLKKGSVYLV